MLINSGLNLPDYSLALQNQGNVAEAITYYQKALTKIRTTSNKIDEAEIENNLGIIYLQIGQLDKAEATFKKGLYQQKLPPVRSSARQRRATCHVRSRPPPCRRAINLAPPSPNCVPNDSVTTAVCHPSSRVMRLSHLTPLSELITVVITIINLSIRLQDRPITT